MSRSSVFVAFAKTISIFALLSIFAGSLTGCGEDSFTTDEDGGVFQGPGDNDGQGSSTDGVRVGFGTGTSFVEGILDVGVSGTLSARGSTTVTGFVVDGDGNPYSSPVTFEFTSTCITNGLASIDSPVTSVAGRIQTTYRAEGCVGTDTIRAIGTVGDSTIEASADISIEAATAGAIEFVSANPESIAVEGTAGVDLSESSTITFRVVDNAGRDAAGVTVNFSLNTTTGGITLDSDTGVTGNDGTVQVAVSSGTVATTVRVTATANTGTAIVSTQSVALSISTGIPDQDSFSIAASKLRPSAWDCNGEEVTISAFVADHFNNPAPDGTSVSFRTEGGTIESNCTTTNGQCSVTWISSEPRPRNDFGTTGLAGRATILATVIGEESYFDTAPSNGRFDDTETFTDLPEVFLNKNENYEVDGNGDLILNNSDRPIPIRDSFEEFLDYNENNQYDGSNGLYNGVLCSPGATLCDTGSRTLTISDDIVLVMASRTQNLAVFQDGGTTNLADSGSINLAFGGDSSTIHIQYQDARNQMPPAGSSISVSTTTGELLGATTTDILDGNSVGPAVFDVTLTAGDNPDPNGILTVTLDIPADACNGNVSVSDQIDISISGIPTP